MEKKKKQFKFLVLIVSFVFVLAGCFHDAAKRENMVETNVNAPAGVEEDKEDRMATSTLEESAESIGEVKEESKEEISPSADVEQESEPQIDKETEAEEEVGRGETEAEPEPEEEEGVTTTTTEMDTENIFTLDEVAKHNTESDCWLILDNKVYDVTNFIPSHPGGKAIVEGCGKDATRLFETRPMGSGTPHSNRARIIRENYYIGDLK